MDFNKNKLSNATVHSAVTSQIEVIFSLKFRVAFVIIKRKGRLTKTIYSVSLQGVFTEGQHLRSIVMKWQWDDTGGRVA